MKKTRNLFVLSSKMEELVPRTIEEVQFKGLISLAPGTFSESAIHTAFLNNKSVLCTGVPPEVAKQYGAITLELTSGSSVSPSTMQINVDEDICTQFQRIADSLDLDIGDHVSNSSGLAGAPTQADCPYCRYLINPRNEVGYPNNQMVYQNDNFFAFTTLGQYILPYLLIIPNKHVVSFAELDDAQRQDFLDVLDDIEYILKKTFHVDNLLVWENGTGHGALGKAKDSLVHAHIHIAASKYSADAIEKLSGFPMTKIRMEDLSSCGKDSYLLIRGKDNGDWRISEDPALYIPRQYVRQIVAEEHGIQGKDTWNWRVFPFLEMRRQATIDIYHMLKANWHHLPIASARIHKSSCLLPSH